MTDHRLGLSLMNLTALMEGEGLQEFIDALRRSHDEDMIEDIITES